MSVNGRTHLDIILVYKIDRLTRSLADFAKIVDVLDTAMPPGTSRLVSTLQSGLTIGAAIPIMKPGLQIYGSGMAARRRSGTPDGIFAPGVLSA